MSLILDTSVIIAVLTNEPHKKQLIEITRGEEALAPLSLRYEIGNAFSAMIRRKRISLAQAQAAIQQYNTISLRLVEVDLKKSMELAAKHNIYAYDAYFIECAVRHNCGLVTLDSKMISIAHKEGISVREVGP